MPTESSPLLIHLHIPKNAGTTLGRSLRLGMMLSSPSHFLRRRIVLGYHNLPHYEKRLAAIAKLSTKQQQHVRIFEAHAAYGLHERLPSPSTYMTMLREPVDRVLSIYYFNRLRGRIDPATPLVDFVCKGDPGRVWWIDNAHVRYLAGEGGQIVDCPIGKVSRTDLERAKERLERDFLFFGLVEQFDVSMNLLRRRLGWHRLYYSTSNVTKKRRSKDDMSPDTLSCIRELNELDLELYDHASSMFQKAVEREGVGAREDLERFRTRNRCYNRTVGRFYWVFSLMRWFRRRLRQAKSLRRNSNTER